MADIRHRRLGDASWTTVQDASLPLNIIGYAAGESVEIQSRDWSDSRVVGIPPEALQPPAAAGALPDVTLSVNESFSIPAAQDFTAEDLSFSLVSGPAWMSMDAGTGLLSGTAPGEASVASVVVRASNTAGQADSGFQVTLENVVQIAIDSASVALPSRNVRLGANNADATYYRIPKPTTSMFVGGAATENMAVLISLDIPWDKLVDDGTGAYWGIFGNNSSGSALQVIGARVHGRDSVTPGVIAVTMNAEVARSVTVDLGAYADVAGSSKGMLAIWRASTDPTGEVYSAWFPADGSAAVSKQTMTGVTGGALRSDVLVGATGHYNTTPVVPYTGSTNSGAFPGHVGMFGVLQGDATEAKLRQVASGDDPQTALSGVAWQALYHFDDPTETSVPVTAGTKGPAALITGASGAAAKGGDTRGAYDAGNVFAVDAVPDGFVWGRKPGATAGTITLSGTGAGLTGGIEVRCANASDGQLVLDWTAATITSGSLTGAWTAEVACQPNTGWGVIDVRPAAAPAMVQRIRQRCGVGTVALALGQSQMNIAVRADTGIKTDYANGGAISAIRRTGGNIGDPLQMMPVEQNAFQLADFFGGAADYLGRISAEPVMFLAEHVSGTGINQLLDDAEVGRSWGDLAAMVAKGGGASNITTTVIQWGTNFMSDANLAGNQFAPLYEGVQPADASFTNNHGLAGYLPAGVVHAVSPLTRHTAADDAAGYTGNAQRCRTDEITYGLGHGFAIGPFCDDYPTGDGSVQGYGPHPYQDTQESQARLGERVLTAIMRAAGKDTTVNPTLAGATRSGAALTIAPTLPNGGALQTYWQFKGLTPPSGALDVSGFEVSEDGGATWSYGESGASIVFSAAISGGSVVLTRGAGSWAAGTQVRYLARGPISFTGLTAAQGNERLRGMLYESGPQEGGLGLPVSGVWMGTAA